jgi:hypothetical protein
MKKLIPVIIVLAFLAGCDNERSGNGMLPGEASDVVSRFLIYAGHDNRQSAAGCLVTMGDVNSTEPDGFCDYGNASERKLTDSAVDLIRDSISQNESYRVRRTAEVPGDGLNYYDVTVEFINDGRVYEIYKFHVVHYDGRYGITGFERMR